LQETFFEICETLSKRATCPRLHTGCVIVNTDNQIIASGYNGAPRGAVHCIDVGCAMRGGNCWRAIHGEENAIIQAARNGQVISGTIMYSLYAPCIRCAMRCQQAGIIEIRYKHATEHAVEVDDLTLQSLQLRVVQV
jgi:dCMP deaminase